MKEEFIYVNYFIDEVLSEIPTKMIYELSEEDEIQNIHYEVTLNNECFISGVTDITEGAVINLQKVLPSNIRIACCQSCRYGNFCPYGDNDNEIFCLKNISVNDKSDVCDYFSRNSNKLGLKSKKLLEFCSDYKPISQDEYYTYNDWGM